MEEALNDALWREAEQKKELEALTTNVVQLSQV